jgi:ADP-ribosylglycohydrolase
MDKEYYFKHVCGGLAGALIGDSMGSATEGMNPEKIDRQFGGQVTKFFPPPEGTFAAGRQPGQLTDDSTQMLEMLDAMVECRGALTSKSVVTHLLHWAKNEELFGKFAGPTTRRAIQKLREGVDPNEAGLPINMLDMVTNGAAMKVAPIGLAHPGDLDAAVRDATTMCIPTHNIDVAYSGAAAVAAAIATAVVPGATQLSVVDAAIYGAKQGYQVGRERAAIIPSPSVVERIRMAVEIAAGQSDFDVISRRLAEIIGCGLSIVETVPVAIGLFVAARGNANRALFGAVNLGGDADTVATITGAIAGAFSGIDQVDPDLVSTIERVNHIELAHYARQLVDLN